MEKNFSDAEYIGLMHEIFCDDIKGHPYRGYIVVNENKNKKSIKVSSVLNLSLFSTYQPIHYSVFPNPVVYSPTIFCFHFQFCSGDRRPIWFVFPGMGSQWPTMGKSLMDIPIFAKSIQNSHKVLESKGIDLIKVITNDDAEIFENILNSFIGIAAIQVIF